MIQTFLHAFIPLFIAVDALGLIPIFMSLTGELEEKEKHRAVSLSVATALLVSLGFVFLGKTVFLILDIRISDFLVAGGVLLFIIAINDLLSVEKKKYVMSSKMVGIVPLGTPLIVGPAVLTTSFIILDSYGISLTIMALILNIVLAGLIFRISNFLLKLVGTTGIRAISKLTSIILSAYGVMMIRKGMVEIVTHYFK